MVGKSIKARARASNIVGARSNPGVAASNIHELILVKGRERNIAWTALSFLLWSILFGRILLLDMSY